MKDYPGVLVVAEGTSRGGKSTFLRTLADGLADCVRIEWNSHAVFRPAVAELKRCQTLDPLTHSLVSVTDYALNFAEVALPALRAGRVVLSDRYLFTSWARDLPRGVPADLLWHLTARFPAPDVVCYFTAPEAVTLGRYRERPEIYGHYATGSDLRPELTSEQAFVRYFRDQSAVYDALAGPNRFVLSEHLSLVAPLLAGRRAAAPNVES
jgi:dTMP kinase